MADYQETARQKMKELSSKDAATRRTAAYYLGEAGYDEAITKLVTLYKSDPDPTVRRAAAYSLGMFRAVEQALARGEEKRVMDLLRRVVDQGKFGRRLRLRPRSLAMLEIIMLVLLVALIALHLLLPGLGPLPGGIEAPRLVVGGPAAETTASPDAPDRQTLITNMQTLRQLLSNDLNTLQRQFQQVLVGSELDCAAFFNEPAPLENADAAAAAYPDLVPAIQTLGNAHATLVEAKGRYEAACFDGDVIAIEAVGGLLAPVVASLASLEEITPLLSPTEEVAAPQPSTPEPTEITATPTEAATPTPEPTAAPTEPLALANPRQHLVTLYGIIDEMRNPRGPAGLLRQYWTDATRAGMTDACRDPLPDVRDDYSLPPQDAEASPELAQAVEQINLGLDLIRQGWMLFETACQTNSLASQAATGRQIVMTAEAAFQTAEGLLNVVRNR